MIRTAKNVLGFTFLTFTMVGCSIEIQEKDKAQNASSGASDSESMTMPEGTEAATVMTLPDELLAPDNQKDDREDRISLTDDGAATTQRGDSDIIPPGYPRDHVVPIHHARPLPPVEPDQGPGIYIRCASGHQEEHHNGPKVKRPVMVRATLKDAAGAIIAGKSEMLGCKKIVFALSRLPKGQDLVLGVSVKRGPLAYTGETEKFTFSGQLLKLTLVLKRSSAADNDDALIDVVFEDNIVRHREATIGIAINDTAKSIKQELQRASSPESIHAVKLGDGRELKIKGIRSSRLSCILPQQNCLGGVKPRFIFKAPVLSQALADAGTKFIITKKNRDAVEQVLIGAADVICGVEVGPVPVDAGRATPAPSPAVCVATPISRAEQPLPVQ